jgi:hypothetical protein
VEPESEDGFNELGRELQNPISSEFRLAAEEDEYWAMKQARRAAHLAEIAYDAMNRGDIVQIVIGDAVFRGRVRHARNDLMVLHGPVLLDVNLAAPLVLRIVERGAAGGEVPWDRGAESFAARLAELEQQHEICEFYSAPDAIRATGRLSIRAQDHVVVEDRDGGEWILPLPWLVAVVHRPRDR